MDSNALSILHIDRQLVDNVYGFKQRMQEISVKCDEDMAIKVHGTESSQQKGVIWIRIHSKSADSRREAIRLINEFTHNACKEVSFLLFSSLNLSYKYDFILISKR